MPFIVAVTTARIPAHVCVSAENFDTSRLAVATLEEAKASASGVVEACPTFDEDAFFATALLPESGGSVGPLPDGTVIEVSRVSWEELAEETDGWTDGVDEYTEWPEVEPRIIAAYNTAQEAK